MVESINSCTLVASSSLISCPPPGTPSLHPIPSPGILADGAVQHARFRLNRLLHVAFPAVPPIVLIALLLGPVAAVPSRQAGKTGSAPPSARGTAGRPPRPSASIWGR